jgi:hypothetical protein
MRHYAMRIYMSTLAILCFVFFLVPGYIVGYIAALLRDGFDAGIAHYERDNVRLTARMDKLIRHRR